MVSETQVTEVKANQFRLSTIDHFHVAYNALCLPPKFCITIVSNFSWILRSSQEKLNTMAGTKRNKQMTVKEKSNFLSFRETWFSLNSLLIFCKHKLQWVDTFFRSLSVCFRQDGKKILLFEPNLILNANMSKQLWDVIIILLTFSP